MAVLPPGKGSQRRPSFRGNILQDTTRGVERTRIWPEPKGSRQTKGQLDQQEWFRQVNWAFKFMAPAAQEAFRKATQGTALYPRDLLSMIASGSFLAVKFTPEKVTYPVAFIQAVSESLDALGMEVGSTLIRGPNFWTVQPPLAGTGVLQTRFQASGNYGSVVSGAPLICPTIPFDEIGLFSAANPNSFKVPANVNRLQFGASCRFNRSSAFNVELAIVKNGSDVCGTQMGSGYPSAVITLASGPIPVVQGDIITTSFRASATSGGTMIGGQTYFWAEFR